MKEKSAERKSAMQEMQPEQIREWLFEQADEKYAQFNAKLIPGDHKIIGVRMPQLRSMAKQIAKGDWQQYEAQAWTEYYEEVLLLGMVLGYAKSEPNEKQRYLESFIPKIDNWAVCDSLCATLKDAKVHPNEWWEFVGKYLQAEGEYEIRFGVVMILNHFITEGRLGEIFEKMNEIHHEGYYVKMAVAWALSICYRDFPEQTMPYLKENQLDDWTYNKTLQKIKESLKISAEQKLVINSMKRS